MMIVNFLALGDALTGVLIHIQDYCLHHFFAFVMKCFCTALHHIDVSKDFIENKPAQI